MATGKNSERSNVLFITADQMRGDCLGCVGHPVVRTPHLDQIAFEGVRFTRAYSATPVCTAARHTIMTGLHPHTHGMPCYRDETAMPDRPTLPGLLGRAGYQTQAVGKMHFFPQRACYGFDHMVVTEEGRTFPGLEVDDYLAFLETTDYGRLSRGHGIGNNEVWPVRCPVPEHLSVTHWTVDRCIDFLKRRDVTRPFFLWCSFTKPHPPFDPPAPYDTMYADREIPAPARAEWSEPDQAPAMIRALQLERNFDLVAPEDVRAARVAYYGLITQIDHQLGRLFGALRARGLLDNTWIILTADHGDLMGDHRLFAKTCWLEGSARVPFILRPPRDRTAVERGAESRAPITLADVLPTVLAAVGLNAPTDIDGVNLLPLAAEPEAKGRPFVHGEYTVDDPADCCQALTDGRWKYIWYPHGGVEHLFGLETDPLEERNLADESAHQEDVKQWRGRLVEVLGARDDRRFTEGHRLRPAKGRVLSERDLRAQNNFGWRDL